MDTEPVSGIPCRRKSLLQHWMFIFTDIKKWKEIKLASSKTTRKRDIEKAYPKKDFIAKLRRLADALERDQPFRLQIAGQRIAVPKQAIINIEHERGAQEEEIEFQIKWQIVPPAKKRK